MQQSVYSFLKASIRLFWQISIVSIVNSQMPRHLYPKALFTIFRKAFDIQIHYIPTSAKQVVKTLSIDVSALVNLNEYGRGRLWMRRDDIS